MMTKSKSYGSLAILTAIAASLCCITPLLAIVAGIGGMASAFSWLEPLRPYLIGITFAVLAFAWYQKLKPMKEMDCDCADKKSSFLKSKNFLGMVTIFAGLMLALPYYTHIFYPETQASSIGISQDNQETAVFNISGMTCKGCEKYVTHAISELDGIQSVHAAYETGKASVQFDKTKTGKDEIIEAIHRTNYKVIE